MTKAEKTRLAIMLPILAVLLVLVFLHYYGESNTSPARVFDATGTYQPMGIENPALRRDLLDHTHMVEYAGRHRNIFDDHLPPPEIKQAPQGPTQTIVMPPIDPKDMPLVFPMKCFGYAEGPAVGMRRAFFTDGDDVFIAGVGETIMNRFRLVKIGNDSVEVEELGSNRHATVAMEQETRSP
ncbi:MAG: hypothetical protein WAM91_15050 [Candidatus Acidiferrales bacterium]